MLPGNAIEVKNISKKFKVYYDKGTTLKEKVLFKKRRSFEERKVLDEISFSVKQGEAIGLVGHNGCGKSTTLKLLTRIMYPDSGEIEIKGRVSSLIELGAGFHPDMTGRENIYTNAAIFGLTRKEIDRRINDIIAFSELGVYIDNPVRTYSSGMYMRLAFSVAINVDAEVLLVDEILGVGDANFQAKCFNKLREIKASGTTIVIVSHSLSQIEQICERSLWIHEGKIREEGRPVEVHSAYLRYMNEKREEQLTQELVQECSTERDDVSEKNVKEIQNSTEELEENKPETEIVQDDNRWGTMTARIQSVRLFSSDEKEKTLYNVGENIVVKVAYELDKPIQGAVIGIAVFRRDGLHCFGTNTLLDKVSQFDLNESGECIIVLNDVGLLPAEYTMDIAIQDIYGVTYDYYRSVKSFEMCSEISDIGIVRLDHVWKI